MEQFEIEEKYFPIIEIQFEVEANEVENFLIEYKLTTVDFDEKIDKHVQYRKSNRE